MSVLSGITKSPSAGRSTPARSNTEAPPVRGRGEAAVGDDARRAGGGRQVLGAVGWSDAAAGRQPGEFLVGAQVATDVAAEVGPEYRPVEVRLVFRSRRTCVDLPWVVSGAPGAAVSLPATVLWRHRRAG